MVGKYWLADDFIFQFPVSLFHVDDVDAGLCWSESSAGGLAQTFILPLFSLKEIYAQQNVLKLFFFRHFVINIWGTVGDQSGTASCC